MSGSSSGGIKVQVKNRMPAPIQITAEQILREARERQIDDKPFEKTLRHITDPEELLEARRERRKEFEDGIRRQRQHLGTYIKYALWEDSQKEHERARSVFERGLEADYRSPNTWLKYAEMEMRNKFASRARNVWDRAVTLLPRIDQFWYKYAYMEEMLGDVPKARAVFERWMRWEPDDHGWTSYIRLEMRHGEINRARELYERYIACHPTLRAYLKYAKWEEKGGQEALARSLLERSLTELPEDERREELYTHFAHFEERCREFERARVVYRFALENLPEEASARLNKEFIQFEKKHGDRSGIEDAIVSKRRAQYERAISSDDGGDPRNYDAWFDYIHLEEAEVEAHAASHGSDDSGPSPLLVEALARARDVYERAIANVPPVSEKRYWRRYIYLWINYALFEELTAGDADNAREIYAACLRLIPHREFSFAKIWIMAAHFEVRRRDLTAARALLGRAIGMCGKEKIFKAYIELELQFGEVDRCRKLYSKYLEVMPHNCDAWAKFAALEKLVGETERARAIFDLAVTQPALDMPEMLWKAFIDFEIENGAVDRTRQLYERLLERTGHVKVWISLAQFELRHGGDEGRDKFRDDFERGYKQLKAEGLKQERMLLLEAWLEAEREAAAGEAGAGSGTAPEGEHVREVRERMPRKLKKRRMVTDETGQDMGWEEYYDYHFPDDQQATANLRILEMAQKWKNKGGSISAAAGGGGAGLLGGLLGKRKAEADVED